MAIMMPVIVVMVVLLIDMICVHFVEGNLTSAG